MTAPYWKQRQIVILWFGFFLEKKDHTGHEKNDEPQRTIDRFFSVRYRLLLIAAFLPLAGLQAIIKHQITKPQCNTNANRSSNFAEKKPAHIDCSQ
ncbi:MAG TPA: hypothetical protein PKY50_16515 [Candidatus Competibacter sp.]|nr:hypothetical protein [Candidatus Competibacter sp.]